MAIARFLKVFTLFLQRAFYGVAFLFSQQSIAQQTQWQLVKESETIKVYQAPALESNFVQVSAQLTVQSSLSGFLLFLQDFQHIPNWLDNANKSELIEQISPARNIFITHFDAVWPVKARNMVIETEYIQQPNLSIDIYVQDASDKIEEVDNSIRVQVNHAHWHIAPVAESGKIKITYQFNVDPKGAVPSWLVNPITLSSVWTTMSNIEAQLPTSEWQSMTLSHITEPDLFDPQ